MAQFDVHENRVDPGYLLDCQSDLLAHLNTRLVVPLFPPDYAPSVSPWLNPVLQLRSEKLVMMTHFASAVPARSLGEKVGSLAEDYAPIMNAFDMLLVGY